MQCPTCKNTDSRVLESRSADTGKSVRRRRECLNCSFRFTTYERVETMPISVLKNDGSRELFNKEKLVTGISRACEKTTFSREAIINFVDGIESQIIQNSNKDIKSSQIGELILKGLRKENEESVVVAPPRRRHSGATVACPPRPRQRIPMPPRMPHRVSWSRP